MRRKLMQVKVAIKSKTVGMNIIQNVANWLIFCYECDNIIKISGTLKSMQVETKRNVNCGIWSEVFKIKVTHQISAMALPLKQEAFKILLMSLS